MDDNGVQFRKSLPLVIECQHSERDARVVALDYLSRSFNGLPHQSPLVIVLKCDLFLIGITGLQLLAMNLLRFSDYELIWLSVFNILVAGNCIFAATRSFLSARKRISKVNDICRKCQLFTTSHPILLTCTEAGLHFERGSYRRRFPWIEIEQLCVTDRRRLWYFVHADGGLYWVPASAFVTYKDFEQFADYMWELRQSRRPTGEGFEVVPLGNPTG